MEAHSLLKRHGFDVSSYGTGSHVKLPGPSLREPNVYDFGTPYKQMFDDLRRKDPELYPPPSLLFILFIFYNRGCLVAERISLSFFLGGVV
ncbi:RNA polymerase II SUBUNIT A C-TERMINAL DOMAIN PHOSPHATASE [Salix purpurea]|jgi:RNA polymerase II subunit A C-terminal domain phosphatase SSU72|uniref:RNA polymerase II subunit A C-terminal domain phosphatase SSU72 n=1 Tax=Salix purpurea TaxID=77065 RepID=A0A9Q0W3M5_SALPP|nr:RNA polymerase II SUBUNIT A C-TERMINAL DOMAIN PHOSPHATASE [Salix purpurea]